MQYQNPARDPRPGGVRTLVSLLFAMLILTTAFAMRVVPSISAADDFGTRVPGQHVYDRAGVLSAAAVADLEARATAVERAGAPMIVYLRASDADEDETRQDARDLMDAWDVQSAPDARDGVVIFLNLKPNDLEHGQAALWVGARHSDGGNLPQYELQRIYDEVMRRPLRDGETAAGIGAGLDALANSLVAGPPPPPEPSPVQRFAKTAAGLPLNLLAALGTAALALVAARTWRRRPAPIAPGAPTLARPGDLPPALVGALVARRLSIGPLAESTILDLARRGALAIEPQGPKQVQVRLLAPAVPRVGFERAAWDVLAESADTNAVIPPKQLARLSKNWPRVEAALRDELVTRGWYDPITSAHTKPLYIGGTVALVAAVIVGIFAIIGQQGWGLLAVGLLAVSGFVAIMLGAYYPQTTPEGEAVAAPWHAYNAGIRAAVRARNQQLDLDAILPDAVALGATSALDRHLKEASERGYVPAWFAQQPQARQSMVAFYPYWIAFHSGVSPSSVSTGSSASSGGAGAGGSF